MVTVFGSHLGVQSVAYICYVILSHLPILHYETESVHVLRLSKCMKSPLLCTLFVLWKRILSVIRFQFRAVP